VILSLRGRVLLLVALLNAALFAGGGYYLGGRLAAANDELAQDLVEKLDVLGSTVRNNIRPEGRLNVAPILAWPAWSIADDAVLIDRNVDRTSEGRIEPRGIDLNPLGSARRKHAFDRQRVLHAIVTAMDTGIPVEVDGGRAMPIEAGGAIWGGCWFRMEPGVDLPGMFQNLLPLFLLSTLLLAMGTFWALRRLVLQPVELLASGARRMREGERGVRLQELERREEMADLVRSFNQMAFIVDDVNRNLEEEVRLATEQARRAESAAMTQRRLAAMGELAAGLAHEINNPLGGLQNAIQSLRDESLTADRRRQYLALLSSGLERIGGTVGRLLRFTPRTPIPAPVDLLDVCRDALGLSEHRAGQLGVELVFPEEASGGAFIITGERNELGQAVLNLLANSLDAIEETGRGGRIVVSLDSIDGEAVLAVQDDGPGVAAEELERISDLFYTTKDVGKGTGLGLALVHSAVDAHGGSMRLESDHGKWFRVELHFPEAPEEGHGE